MATAVPASYHLDLRAPVQTRTSETPVVAVHRVEWSKIVQGGPVEINPSVGDGYRVMSVDEWAARWRRSDEFPDCLGCGSRNTKEHAFTQTWCRGKRVWEAESLCLDCHRFSWRHYRDPDFKTPEEHDKATWTALAASAAP